jgi:hypothetical protein
LRATHTQPNRAREVSIYELRRQSKSLASLGPSWKDKGIVITVSLAQELEEICEAQRSPTESPTTSPPISPVWPVSEPSWAGLPGELQKVSDKPSYSWSIGPVAEKISARHKVPLVKNPPPGKRLEKIELPWSLAPTPKKVALRSSSITQLEQGVRSRSVSPEPDRLSQSLSINPRSEKPTAHSFRKPLAHTPPVSVRELPATYTARMASRGARARKITEKNIVKEEKKYVEKERAERFARLHSPIGSVNTGSRPFSPTEKNHFTPWNKAGSSVQSSAASVTSNGSNGSAFSSIMGSRLSSIDERKKYAAKGKTTKAPRGRGGGVPVKLKNFDDQRSKSSFSYSTEARSNKSRSHSMSSDSAPSASFERSWNHTKLYVGGGQPARPYPGFEHDDDMWTADGDCLIFFSEETSDDNPRPMLRVHKGVLEQARSTFMINLLRYGEIVHEDDDTPPSSAGPTSPPTSQWPLTPTSLGNLDQLLSENTGRLGLKSPRVPETPKYGSDRDTWSTSDQTLFSPGDRERPRTGVSGAKMPMSGVGTAVQSPAESLYGDQHHDGAIEITHEIWFRAPSHIKRPDIQRRHHMATRNYIALL